jgi:4-amino-4-deoxy-L-arabinose transferase-like glycosyltransferase
VRHLDVRRTLARWNIPPVLLAVVLVVLALELIVAATTAGTNDILHWTDFVNAVRQHGPVGVYAATIRTSYYNHPPLMGYVLLGVDGLRHFGVSIAFTMRAMSSLASAVVAFLVYALVRRRRGERQALVTGVLVACSPVLFTISAFHGNTDPIFSMLVLLAVYLMAARERAGWAGATIALAVGVKFPAVIALPALAAYALTRGWRFLLRFSLAAGAVFLVSWGPAVAFEWRALKAHVIDYKGLGMAQWGLMQLGHWAGDPSWVAWARGSGRFWIVVLCAGVPAVLVLRRPRSATIGVPVALCAFLAASPEFAAQYLAWAAAASFVVSFWGGLVYNVFAGWLLIGLYNRWNHTFFATSHRIDFYHPFTPHEVVFLLVPWSALVITTWSGLRDMWAEPRERKRGRRISVEHPTNRDSPYHHDLIESETVDADRPGSGPLISADRPSRGYA